MHLANKLGQFNREKIPERVVHARGMTAKGYFEVSNSRFCRAKLFSSPYSIAERRALDLKRDKLPAAAFTTVVLLLCR